MLSTVQAVERLKKEVGQHDFRGWYRFQYLKSDHWKRLRKEKIKSSSFCEICRNNSPEQVHHVRYRSIYDVELSDLQAVCRTCHCAIHGKIPNDLPTKKFSEFRDEYEAREREVDELEKKHRRNGRKKTLSPDASVRYAAYLEKTSPFRFRGNRY